MQRHEKQALLGREVLIYVSELFGFEYPGGGTGMRARVVEVRLGESGDPSVQALRLKLEIPFVSEEGPTIRYLTADGKHKLPEGIVEILAAGGRIPVSLSYSDQVPKERRLPGTTPKLIGGVWLASAWPDDPALGLGEDRRPRGGLDDSMGRQHLLLDELTEEDLAALAGRQPMPPAAVGSGLSDVSENHDHYHASCRAPR